MKEYISHIGVEYCSLCAVKNLLIFLILAVVGIFLLYVSPAIGQEEKKPDAWQGKDADGNIITEKHLAKILEKHKKWVETEGKEGKRAILKKWDLSEADLLGANLSEADLSGANLSGANLFMTNLSEANLHGANLSEAKLSEAELHGANLSEAKLSEAELHGANLSKANLSKAYLIWADLFGANLHGANLREANLRGAFLIRADFDGADLREADLRDALLIKAILYNADLRGADLLYATLQGANLSKAYGLAELREKFNKAGLRKQERIITYTIKRTERIELLVGYHFFSTVEGLFNFIMFELTCNYGMSPGRPLLILVIFILFFSIPYVITLRIGGTDGIWKIWIPDRVRKDLGENEPIRLTLHGFAALRTGFYFSVLSAFSIGWRELNVGNWIARLQRREYTIRATGVTRTISGIQSLISVYLVALWILTYFGRPFG